MAEWITTKEASEILGVSIRTIQRYVVAGKLKSKIVAGKNSVKKEAVSKLKPETQTEETPVQTLIRNHEKELNQPNWQVPDGYLLIDKSTLESLHEQIKKLTDSVSEMQLTQKLLIEKGLNLKEEKEAEKILNVPKADQPEQEIINTPIENVAKAHEDFFGKKQRQSNLNLIWLALSVFVGIALLVIAVNIFANI
jgi:excisionase family DNA binding protein